MPIKSPCIGCDLEYEDKDNNTCGDCEKRIAYIEALAGPMCDSVPGYDFPDVRPGVDDMSRMKTSRNLRPLVECIYPWCTNMTREKSGYCHPCGRRNSYRKETGIPFDAPIIKTGRHRKGGHKKYEPETKE